MLKLRAWSRTQSRCLNCPQNYYGMPSHARIRRVQLVARQRGGTDRKSHWLGASVHFLRLFTSLRQLLYYCTTTFTAVRRLCVFPFVLWRGVRKVSQGRHDTSPPEFAVCLSVCQTLWLKCVLEATSFHVCLPLFRLLCEVDYCDDGNHDLL